MDPMLTRLLLVLALIAVVALLGWAVKRRDGRIREAGPAPRGDGGMADHEGPAFDAAQLDAVGLDLAGVRAGAVLLSSPTCAPCAMVKRILGELSEQRDDIAWVSVEAADHLDLARDHHVMRVPTLFVLDPQGRILARTSGVPARTDLERVLDRAESFSSSA
jgi:hypothetical protein